MSEHAEFERLLDEYATAQAQHWEHSRNFGQEEKRATLLAHHERVVRERDNWQETAAQHCRNEFFYADLLRDVGSLFPDCYVSDDGSVQDQPLALKVKECVQAALAERDARIAELEEAARVPGMMRCAKCEFVLTRTNLYVNQGTTGPGSSETEPCPNGCGPLWPMTWRDYATGMDKTVMRYLDERDEARAALAERDAALTKETTLCHRMIDERDHYREKAHSAEKELAERDARIAHLQDSLNLRDEQIAELERAIVR